MCRQICLRTHHVNVEIVEGSSARVVRVVNDHVLNYDVVGIVEQQLQTRRDVRETNSISLENLQFAISRCQNRDSEFRRKFETYWYTFIRISN